jgi:hypothetical protein
MLVQRVDRLDRGKALGRRRDRQHRDHHKEVLIECQALRLHVRLARKHPQRLQRWESKARNWKTRIV